MSKKIMNFLVLEDDDLARLNLVTLLKESGLVSEARNTKEAIELIKENTFDMAWIDLDLEKELAGLDVIPLAVSSGAYTIVLSGREEDEYIERAYESGCEDYLSKPFEKKSLELVLRKFKIVHDEGKLRNFFSKNFITQDENFIKDLRVVKEIISSDKPIFIKGPTGTGKTLICKLIHELIFETQEKFIHLNCSEIPENLLESELFGHKKGAFSGADKDKLGKLELAAGGTLFLDEIATMPLLLQKKLLKAIDEKTFYPLGSEKEVKSNFRLMSATCEDLNEMVKDGRFREDLYFRIEGYNLDLPPLKNRPGDIELLIKHFLGKGKRRVVLSKEVKERLLSYNWPGNVRELKKVIEVLQSKSSGLIKVNDLPIHILGESPARINLGESLPSRVGVLTSEQMEFIRHNGLRAFVDEVEIDSVTTVFKENEDKVRQSLNILKISNSTFYKILKRANDE